MYVHVYDYLSINLSIYLYLSIYLSVYLSIYLSIHLSSYLSINLSFFPLTHPSSSFILNKGWVDESATPNRPLPTYDEITGDHNPDSAPDSDADLSDVERQEDFERRYNFRFEEEGASEIVTYSRHVDSVRRSDGRRAASRRDRNERKESEKEQKRRELDRLAQLKQQEILEKLRHIQEVTGTAIEGAFAAGDLDADYDPSEFDQKMAAVFDEEYYEEGEGDKPVFDEEEDAFIMGGPEDDDGDDGEEEQVDKKGKKGGKKGKSESDWTMDEQEPISQGANESKNKKKKKKKKNKEPSDEMDVETFNMDADYADDANYADYADYADYPADSSDLPDLTSKKGRKRASSAIDTALETAAATSSDAARLLDDYYSLGYEDIVGDLPTRFKYRKVAPQSYGLTPVEILLADDADLNAHVSLKKLAPYREAGLAESDARKSTKAKRVRQFRERLRSRLEEEGRKEEVADLAEVVGDDVYRAAVEKAEKEKMEAKERKERGEKERREEKRKEMKRGWEESRKKERREKRGEEGDVKVDKDRLAAYTKVKGGQARRQ